MKKHFKLYEGIRQIKNDLRAQMHTSTKKSFVVLVAGGSASGKTSMIAERIYKEHQKEALIMSMDNYYIGREHVEKLGITYDEPAALDLNLFFKHLKQLKSGKAIDMPIYDFQASKRSDKVQTVQPKQLIIVEGLYALHERLQKLGDYKVFVDLGTHGRMLRRIFRDVTRTGEKPGDILKYFSKVVEPKEYEHIEPTKKYADIVVENLYVPFVESRNSRHKETQLKYEVSPDIAKEVGRVVHSLGGIFVGEVFDQDLFLLANSRDLKKTDEIMRIRLIGLGRYILSYRGPKVKGKEFDARYGINFYIDYDTYTAFHSVYGHISKVLNKQRKNYFLKGFLISVDTFESGKVYLDIRVEDGSQKAVLESLLQNLGLSGRKPTTQTYLELIH